MKKTNIYIWCSNRQLSSLLNYYEAKDYSVRVLVWHKTNPLPAANNTYLNDTEFCVFARAIGVPLTGSIKEKVGFWITPINVNDKNDFEHPTIKPLEIIKNLIKNSSNENDVVLDPFMGSGTTAVACKELNRNYIGFEIDEHYHKLAVDRVNGIKANGQMSLLDTNFEEMDLFNEGKL